MMRTAQAIGSSLARRPPRGWALAGAEHFRRLLDVIATALSTAEAEPAALMDEIDPRVASRLLPDFERVLGPDPCGRDTGDLTSSQRQSLAHQRWTARGGQSIPYFVAIAVRLGVEVEIEEYWPSVTGDMEAGEELIAEGEQFTWTVKLALIGEWDFIAGENVAGETLGGLILSDIECEFRRLKPAHTQVVFSYT